MRHATLTIFILLFIVLSPPAYADLFTIEDVKIDVTATNAVEARDQAFNKAQEDAFALLTKRIASEGEIASPGPDVISTMIRDFEVTGEKLSGVRYVGTYKFRFDENIVKQYFSQQGRAYIDVGSQPALILPFFQPSTGPRLWGHPNPWLAAWNQNISRDAVVPLIVPIGDLDDVSDIKDEQVFDYNPIKLERMLGRYNADEAILIIADPDAQLESTLDNPSVNGVLELHLYRTDRGEPEYAQNLVLNAQPGESADDLFTRGVREAQKILRRNWKQRIKAVNETGKNQVFTMRTRFSSLQQWATVQRRLAQINGIEGMEVTSLSPTGADITLNYRGSEQRFRLALEQQDLSLSDGPDPFSQYAAAAGRFVYDLYLNESLRAPIEKSQSVSPQNYQQRF